MVICMLGTLSHMLDNQQASACFQHVSKHLRPGGLFVLELAHPGKRRQSVKAAVCQSGSKGVSRL